MTDRTIALGSDHAGFELKAAIAAHLAGRGWQVTDVGPSNADRVDYPTFGEAAARLVQAGTVRFGIIICGTGVGISLAANKLNGIRCVVCSEPFTAAMARAHNDANMLALGGRVVGPGLALAIVDAFLDAKFEAGRHQARIDMITAIETRAGHGS